MIPVCRYNFIAITIIVLTFATVSSGSEIDRIFYGISKSQYYSFRVGIGQVIGESNFFNSDWLFFRGYSLSADMNFNKKGVNSVGLLATASSSTGIFAGRLNLGVYKGIKYNWLATITPEVGLSFLECLSIYYGYNFNVAKPASYPKFDQRITFCWSFNTDVLR